MKRFLLNMNRYNMVLLVPLFLVCYLGTVRTYAWAKAQIYKARETGKRRTYTAGIGTSSRFKHRLYNKIPLLPRLEIKLYRQGYPLGLNVFRYLTAKLLMAFGFFFAASNNYKSILIGLLAGAVGFILIDVYLYLNRTARDHEVCKDLLNVSDSLYLQISASVSLKDALSGLHTACKNKDFKDAFVRLVARYELGGYNMEHAADEFENAFDNPAVSMFCAALRQYAQTGSILEMLENISKILKDSYLDRLNLYTNAKTIYITLGVILILCNIVALVIFPIFVNLSAEAREIFR